MKANNSLKTDLKMSFEVQLIMATFLGALLHFF